MQLSVRQDCYIKCHKDIQWFQEIKMLMPLPAV